MGIQLGCEIFGREDAFDRQIGAEIGDQPLFKAGTDAIGIGFGPVLLINIGAAQMRHGGQIGAVEDFIDQFAVVRAEQDGMMRQAFGSLRQAEMQHAQRHRPAQRSNWWQRDCRPPAGYGTKRPAADAGR